MTVWLTSKVIIKLEFHFSELNTLIPSDIVGNCKKAFEAGEKLGIPRVIEPSDMSLLAVPDKLAVMTYLYQLHAHFTGRQLEVDRIGEFLCVLLVDRC
jgi:hypothetical protein